MHLATDPWIWAAALLTLAVFSFLFEDNPAYCFAEHLVVGLSAGYMIATEWHNVFRPELVDPLLAAPLGAHAHLWVAVALCLCFCGRFLEKTRDLYRVALAFSVAVSLGVSIPTTMEAEVLAQISGAMRLSFGGDLLAIAGNLVLATGTLAALVYFFFSAEHRGAIGHTATIGLMVLMVGFGATFSYTILSRVYLLIGRVSFLVRDVLGLAS